MRLYKPVYIDRSGQQREISKWYADFFTPDGIRHRLPLFFDKRASENFGRNIEELCGLQTAGMVAGPELQRWIDGLPVKLSDKLVSWGLISNQRVAAGNLLSKHLQDWRGALLASGCTVEYADLKTNRARTIFERCGFRTFADVSGSKIQLEIAKLKRTVQKRINGRLETIELGPVSGKTKNDYLQACRQFTYWMMQDRRAGENPLQYLKPQGDIEQTYRRRALEPDEVRRLLEATTEAAGPRFGMDGYQRTLLYRLAVETGLRRNELKTLTVGSFDFDRLTVKVEAGYSKHRCEDVLPLRKETAAAFRIFLTGKLPTARVFNMPDKTAKMFQADLVAAGIEQKNDRGIVDFHSLRHTFGTLLAASGVHPKTAQTLMRHSDINLTMSRYTHTLRGAESEAIESIPDFSKPAQQSQKKTGTDDKNVFDHQFGHQFAHKLRIPDNTLDYSGLNTSKTGIAENSDIAAKTAILNEKQGKSEIRPTGFEPATPGLGNRCSILLSYGRPISKCLQYNKFAHLLSILRSGKTGRAPSAYQIPTDTPSGRFSCTL